MGEIAKKWLAGLGAALVVTVVAVISIGTMERKSKPELSTQIAAGSGPALSQVSTVQLRGADPSTQMVVPAESAVQENTRLATLGRSSQKVLVAETKAVGEIESMAGPKRMLGPGSVSDEIPGGSSERQFGQAKSTTVESRPATMPVSLAEGMYVTGNTNVNGEFSNISRLVYPNDLVLTPGLNGALVTAKQNTIALGATTQFKPESMNSFQLDAGASNVSTQTGMTATVKDWRVQPVHSGDATQYEVTYEGDAVYVYARVNDVDVVNDVCRRSIRVEQGKVVRISSARGCGIVWVQNEVRTLPYKVVWGSAAAAGTGVLIWIATHQERPELSPP